MINMALSEEKSCRTLRIIDASLNRVGEGLRLLEDIARLLLNDATLTQQLKTVRHELLRGDYSFHQQLLQFRDSEGDVGIDIEVPGEEKERELPVVLVANARRVQESLRVLEELAKIPGYEVAGKTGTAETSKDKPTHAWFVGFFPYEKPKFVICVFLENGGPGYAASVVTKQIIEEMNKQGLI